MGGDEALFYINTYICTHINIDIMVDIGQFAYLLFFSFLCVYFVLQAFFLSIILFFFYYYTDKAPQTQRKSKNKMIYIHIYYNAFV